MRSCARVTRATIQRAYCTQTCLEAAAAFTYTYTYIILYFTYKNCSRKLQGAIFYICICICHIYICNGNRNRTSYIVHAYILHANLQYRSKVFYYLEKQENYFNKHKYTYIKLYFIIVILFFKIS